MQATDGEAAKERRWADRGLSLVELLVVIGIVGVLASVLLPALARSQEAARRASCANNLRQIATAFKMFADEHDGYYPPVALYGPERGEVDCGSATFPPPLSSKSMAEQWAFSPTFDASSVYPDYVVDGRSLFCPSDPDSEPELLKNPASGFVDLAYPCDAYCRGSAVAASSYVYFGYALDKIGPTDSTITYNLLPPNYVLSAFAPFTLLRNGLDDVPVSAQALALYQTLVDTAWLSARGILPDGITQQLVNRPSVLVGPPPLRESIGDLIGHNWGNDLGSLNEGKLGTGDSHGVLRLRNGVERYLVTDSNALRQAGQLPILFDRMGVSTSDFHHAPSMVNVLFMDGHSQSVAVASGSDFLSSSLVVFVGGVQEFRIQYESFEFGIVGDISECRQ